MVCVAGACTAADYAETSKSSFVSYLVPGSSFNDFSAQTPGDGPLASIVFSGGAPQVSYTITAPPSGLFVNYPPDTGVGNWSTSDPIVISFTSGNVHTVGADFFLNDINGKRLSGSISLSYSDGTSAVVPSFTSGPYGFFGLSSTSVITTLTVEPSGNFINVGNLYVSSAVIPEPGGAALCALGAGVCLLRRKQS